MFCALLILFNRRKEITSSNEKPKKINNQTGIYELAADVTGTVDSLDKNGRLVSTRSSNMTTDDAHGVYAEVEMFGGYESFSPVQVSGEDSKSDSPIYSNEVGAGKADKDGKGNDELLKDGKVVYDTPPPVNVADDSLYANVKTPAPASPPPAPPSSSSSAAAAAGEKTQEPICTSINDFTLIDNVIYNQ